jgi:hypothetical protein
MSSSAAWAEVFAGGPGYAPAQAGTSTKGGAVFVQVIRGQVDDAAAVRAAMDRWAAELAPGAIGWLGSTAGVTEDGRFIALARFEAGFVQIMRGRGTDPDRARELMAQDSEAWADFRPDIIGSLAVGHEGGAYTMAIYFTSEAEAREGERKEPPPQLKAQMDEMGALSVGEPEFLDLRQPWLYSPR